MRHRIQFVVLLIVLSGHIFIRHRHIYISLAAIMTGIIADKLNCDPATFVIDSIEVFDPSPFGEVHLGSSIVVGANSTIIEMDA